MAGPGLALIEVLLCLGFCLAGGCDFFSAIGPNGCDDLHPCRNPARPRCDRATQRCLAASGVHDGGNGADGGPQGPCRVHGDCPSTLCDEFGVTTAQPGQCIAPEDAQTVGSAAELWAALPARHGIRLQPGTYAGNWQVVRPLVLVGPRAVNLPARLASPPAILSGKDDGPVVLISGQARVMMDGVTLRNGRGTGGHGVLCDNDQSRLWMRRVQTTANEGRGVWARCPLQMDQSVVGEWLNEGELGNLGGGILAESEVRITNSFFVRNGSDTASFGAIGLMNPSGKQVSRLLAQLTLVDNHSPMGGAIDCHDAGPTDIWQSLFFGNLSAGLLPTLIGWCVPHAMATDDLMAQGVGDVHFDDDHPPNFLGGGDSHLQRDSPAVDTVPREEGGPELDHDFDGDPRPIGKARDFGADEVVLF